MRVLTAIDRGEIAALLERDEFFWLDLRSPSEADVEGLGEQLQLHPLAVRQTQKFGQRPHLDPYEGYIVLVFYGAERERRGRAKLIEAHLIVSGSYVVTVHREHCAELDELRDYFAERQSGAEQFVVYRVLDALTDTFFPVLASLDEDIDTLEDEVIAQPTDEQLRRIADIKRDLVFLRRVITPERDVFARGGDDIVGLPGLEPATRDYFRDLYDHLIRISDLIDSYRDLVTGAMDLYLSTVSNRLNVVMKQLTIIATIFLPLTLVVGFFGMNFGWMVNRIDTLWTFALLAGGGLLAPAVYMLVSFRRKGWM